MTPAGALAADLTSRGYDVQVITDDRGIKYKAMFGDVPMHVVKAGSAGKGLGGRIKGAADVATGLTQAGTLLLKFRPTLVVGFGGYPSFPAVYAAQIMGIKTIIHEQNAIIGKANDMLANKAERIAMSMPTLQGLDPALEVNSVYTGNPVRPEIAALYTQPYPARQPADAPFHMLVMGGSLGARVFSDIVPRALAELAPDYKARLRIVQQCRAEDLESAKALYAEAGIEAELTTFIDDVAGVLKQSQLVIARSGASTVAELCVAGRPAIFVPYPHHKDQQQKRNADAVADAGGGWVMSESGFTLEALRSRMEMILQNPQSLFEAAEAARAHGQPDAARKLGNLVTALVSGW